MLNFRLAFRVSASSRRARLALRLCASESVCLLVSRRSSRSLAFGRSKGSRKVTITYYYCDEDDVATSTTIWDNVHWRLLPNVLLWATWVGALSLVFAPVFEGTDLCISEVFAGGFILLFSTVIAALVAVSQTSYAVNWTDNGLTVLLDLLQLRADCRCGLLPIYGYDTGGSPCSGLCAQLASV